MGKTYEGNVEVFTNKETKKVNIRPNPDGDFNKENAGALYKFMKQDWVYNAVVHSRC